MLALPDYAEIEQKFLAAFDQQQGISKSRVDRMAIRLQAALNYAIATELSEARGVSFDDIVQLLCKFTTYGMAYGRSHLVENFDTAMADKGMQYMQNKLMETIRNHSRWDLQMQDFGQMHEATRA